MDILELCATVSEKLIEVYELSKTRNGNPGLLFPSYSKGGKEELRISEQESRVVFTQVIPKFSYFFSIESPTERKYSFSNSTLESARSDLSLYDNAFKKFLNIEFKANNPVKTQLKKDIQKLIGEKYYGLWFHTLKNMDRGTLRSTGVGKEKGLFDKFVESFEELKKESPHPGWKNTEDIIFYFVVLEWKLSFYKRFRLGRDRDNINEFFRMDFEQLKASRRNPVHAIEGWKLCYGKGDITLSDN